MFEHHQINSEILKQRAFNLRWATLPQDVIPLTAADPDFPSAPEITEAIIKYSKDRYYCYSPAEGLPELKQSLSVFFNTTRKVPAKPELCLPVDSAAFGIHLICKTILSPEDEAIIFDPVDFLFKYSIESVGATAVRFPIPPGTEKVDFSKMESLINEKTKLICLCNPLNPTGKVFDQEELTALGNLAIKHRLMILSDEIWSDIVFSPANFTSIAAISDQIRQHTIIVTGFSKSYGLAGLRIGAVIAPDQHWFNRLLSASMHTSTVHGVNVLSQVAAAAALNQCADWLDAFVQHLTRVRNLFIPELNNIPGFKCISPQGCYVAFVDIRETGLSSQQIQELLMNKAKLAVVPGLSQWFGPGAEGYIRMSFATSEELIIKALDRIKTVVR